MRKSSLMSCKNNLADQFFTSKATTITITKRVNLERGQFYETFFEGMLISQNKTMNMVCAYV